MLYFICVTSKAIDDNDWNLDTWIPLALWTPKILKLRQKAGNVPCRWKWPAVGCLECSNDCEQLDPGTASVACPEVLMESTFINFLMCYQFLNHVLNILQWDWKIPQAYAGLTQGSKIILIYFDSLAVERRGKRTQLVAGRVGQNEANLKAAKICIFPVYQCYHGADFQDGLIFFCAREKPYNNSRP